MKRISYLLPVILLAILYFPLFDRLYSVHWKFIDYEHAKFVLPLFLGMAWASRGGLQSLAATSSPKPLSPALFLLVFGLLSALFGVRHGYLSIQAFSLIPIILGGIWYVAGGTVMRRLLFPVLYLALLIPPPQGMLDQLTLPMRYFTSIVIENTLVLFRLPVARDGLLLTMDQQEIFLGAPCSGFRSLITLLTLSLAYIYVKRGSLRKNLILIGAILPLTLLGNFLRVLALCLMTYFLGKETAEGFFHDFSGMIVFLILSSGLIVFERVLSRRDLHAKD